MIPSPLALRARVYDVLLDRGLPPSCTELGAHFSESADAIRAALGAMKIGKTIQMRPDGSEIWMAGPFAAEATAFRVIGRHAAWWANCAWDAFGVAVIAGEPAHVATHCPDCDEPLELLADPARAPNEDLVMHFLVQARHWYDDLGFT
jgi:hypothetical protein